VKGVWIRSNSRQRVRPTAKLQQSFMNPFSVQVSKSITDHIVAETTPNQLSSLMSVTPPSIAIDAPVLGAPVCAFVVSAGGPD